MKTNILLIYLLSLVFALAAVADVKITQLPLGDAASSGLNSVFPYVDTGTNITKKLKLSDLVNVPALSTPSFCTAKPLTGFVSSSGTVSATDTVLQAIGKLAGTVTPGAPISIGTYDSQAGDAKGLVLSSNVLYAQSATASVPGMVSTGGQTWAGTKNLSIGKIANLTTNGLVYVTAADGTTNSGTLTGDLTSSGLATTLATVNSNVGSFTYASITVNGKGLITAASSGAAPVTSLTVASANGFAGSFSASSTPVLTLTTTVTGLLKGNGTAISAAVSGTDYAPATSGSSPLFGNGLGGFTNGTVTGNTTKVATSTGSISSGNCASWDASGNIVDAGAACGSGAGTVTTTGSPASGNLTKFSGASSITNGDLSGDLTTSGTLATTLATVNANVGSFGSSTSIPSFTVNGKGLITAASGNAVIAPAGTLTGTTLASGVVTSSLTSVGTIGTGVWQGTTVGVGYGGTGQTSYTDGQLLIGNSSGNTLTKATLTQGSGITITNGNGSITIAASGGGSGSAKVARFTCGQGTGDANTLVLLNFDDASTIYDYGTAGTAAWNKTTYTSYTAAPKFGPAAMDGHATNSHVDRAALTAISSVGTGNFTIDFWVKFFNLGNYGIISYGDGAGLDDGDIDFQWDNNNTRWTFQSKAGATTTTITGTDTLSTGVWYHVAIVRSATNTLTIYRDGTSKGSGISNSSFTTSNASKTFIFGYSAGTSQIFDGYSDEFRFSDTARWTSGFTPPSSAYAITNTVTSDPSTMISSVDGGSTPGLCTVNFTGGTFSVAPKCQCMTYSSASGEAGCHGSAVSTTSALSLVSRAAGANANTTVDLSCQE